MYKGMNFGGGMNMQSLMKQAQKMQEEMQNKLERAEEELQNATITGTSGGGMVEVTCNGKMEFSKVTLNPQVVDPDDVEMLEDLITAAVNDATTKAKEMEKNLKGDMPAGLGF